jgi:hypothetical protein
MERHKTVNFILFIGLVGLVMFWQRIVPFYEGRDTAQTRLFLYGCLIGLLFSIGALVASVFWWKDYRSERIRFSEFAMPVLVFITSCWVSVTMFYEWLHDKRQ